MNIFGIKIDNCNKEDLIKKCFERLVSKNEKTLFIATLNPEIVLTARNNLKYKEALNSANLKITDGVGIQIISWLKKREINDRITGADLARILITRASEINLKTGIIFRKDGLSSEKEIRESLNSFKNIKLLGIKKEENSKNIKWSPLSDCQLVLVATGHPHQELLIQENLSKLPNLKIIMGIGGTLDYWTGKKIRAPRLIRAIGLEWFWRLIIQPNRFFRIFNAVIKFPVLAILNKEENEQ